MPSQSLRVPVAALIEKAEAERARIVAEHAKLKAGRPETPTRSRERLAQALYELARDLRAGKRKPTKSQEYLRAEGGYVDVLRATVYVTLPRKVGKPDTEKVDRDLRLLRATSQATVSMRLDSDFARYV